MGAAKERPPGGLVQIYDREIPWRFRTDASPKILVLKSIVKRRRSEAPGAGIQRPVDRRGPILDRTSRFLIQTIRKSPLTITKQKKKLFS
ncbi:hypothetical protein EVAR_62643_1 [Eumeta japonica]|uniref:Uncharacterized protein n=1 Tax=Eumeta variegata TaxID=151549 RepID=A0A4C1ZD06_EUMVA|nr:hypothetical protein EVAR_62643_1 [Eumeta japonica]